MAEPRRFVYEHPAEAGLGEHHADPADPPMDARPLYPGAPTDWAPGQLTMADMDMPHGTQVTLATDEDPESPGFGQPVRDDDRDLEIVEWTDPHGHARRTSVSPGFFGQHFREVTP